MDKQKDKLGFIKIENFIYQKIKKVKRLPENRTKFINHTCNQDLMFIIDKELLQIKEII